MRFLLMYVCMIIKKGGEKSAPVSMRWRDAVKETLRCVRSAPQPAHLILPMVASHACSGGIDAGGTPTDRHPKQPAPEPTVQLQTLDSTGAKDGIPY